MKGGGKAWAGRIDGKLGQLRMFPSFYGIHLSSQRCVKAPEASIGCNNHCTNFDLLVALLETHLVVLYRLLPSFKSVDFCGSVAFLCDPLYEWYTNCEPTRN